MAWAVIGGSGTLPLVQNFAAVPAPPTAYGTPSAPVRRGRVGNQDVLFLARHGEPHRLAPHLVRYRANVAAIQALGAHGIVALNTVGGITERAATGAVVVPDQVIDYTWGRAHTFSDEDSLVHADFGDPLDGALRRSLVAAARTANVDVTDGGVYGCTQGPRFETAAEIDRMERDGCDVVGMTGMPEAALARECGIPYAMLSLVVNPAAGRSSDPFDMDAIAAVAAEGMERLGRLLVAFFEGGVGG